MGKTIAPMLGIFILLCSFAYADDFTARITYSYHKEDMSLLNDVKVVGYTCLDASCSAVTDVPFYVNQDSGSMTSQTVVFPQVLSQYGYAMYYFRSGYLPMEYTADWHGVGTATFDIVFPKMKDAKAEISSFEAIGDHETGKEVLLKASVASAFTEPDAAPGYLIPEYLNEFYSSVVRVTFRVYYGDQKLLDRSYESNILMDTEDSFTESWTPLEDGDYRIFVYTEVIDDQVSSTLKLEKMIIYKAETPDNIGPEIELLNPENLEILPGFIAELSYRAIDPSGIDSCTLYIDGTAVEKDISVVSGIDSSFIAGPLSPGQYEWKISCTDKKMNKALSEVRSFIIPKEQEITDIECFPIVVASEHQSCSVHVKADGVPVDGALVRFYDAEDDSYLGSCSSPTDSISGGCTGMWVEPASGERTVYATAHKAGYMNDTDKDPRFHYLIYTHRYDILELKVYNDSEYTIEDYDFFRAELMYVKFKVFDTVKESLVFGIVTDASLVSAPGGREKLVHESEDSSWYYYSLRIPPTHEFLGDSQVFAFAFNFTDMSGGEKWVPLIIRNNPPIIMPLEDLQMVVNDTVSIDLSLYESDIEDSGDGLRWELSHVDVSGATLVGKTLKITPLGTGLDVVMLKLFDLDNDFDTHLLAINIGEFVYPNRAPYFVSRPNIRILEPYDSEFNVVYTYDADAIDPDGDELVYSLVDYPFGMTINSSTGMVRWKPVRADLGTHIVTVMVSDGEYSAVQSYNLTVEIAPKPEDIYPRRTLFVETLRMNGMPDDILRPGDQLYVSTSLENIGFNDIDYVTVRSTCEGLGISRKWGPYSGPEKDMIIRGGVMLDIPLDAEPGYYTCRTTIRTDSGLIRTKHRDIRII